MRVPGQPPPEEEEEDQPDLGDTETDTEEGEPEYDDDGNEIVADEPPADEEPDTAPEEPEAPYVPPSAATGETPEAVRLRELLADAEVSSAIQATINAEVSRQMQAQSAANIHVMSAAAEHPELFRKYGARINHTLSELPADTRSRAEAVHIAIARVVMEDAPKAGLAKTLRQLADLAEGQPVQKAPKAPIPAAQRPPSPASRASAPSAGKENVDRLMARYEVTRAEAEEMLSEVSRPLAGGTRRAL